MMFVNPTLIAQTKPKPFERQLRQREQIIILDNDTQRLKDVYANAFKTKEKTEVKKSNGKRFPDKQKDIDLCFWYEPGTWLMDLVSCGSIWYVFFIGGNSRFLIVLPGNASLVDGNIDRQPGRVKSDHFLDIFTQFRHKAGNVKHLIGDSERAFWSQTMMENYRQFKIKTTIINTAQDGHTQLSILDRAVRTIRDMNANLGQGPEILLPQMNQLVTVYNNTKHGGLESVIGKPITPRQIHSDKSLELQYMRNAKANNWVINNTPGFIVEPGTKILVRQKYKMHEKRRGTSVPGNWRVVDRKGLWYDVRESKSGQMMKVRRRDIMPL